MGCKYENGGTGESDFGVIVYGQVESEQLDSPKSGRSGNIKNCSILPYKIL